MEQFSIHIHGNNSPTSIEFVEKQYKLGAGETLVGKADDFPEKKSIKFFTDWEYTEGEIEPLKPTTLPGDRTIDLGSWIEEVFPRLQNENLRDKGITLEIDFLFFMNHWAQDSRQSPVRNYHISLTANATIRFNILYTNNEKYYCSDLKLLNTSGNWVEYTTNYGSVTDSGQLLATIAGGFGGTANACFSFALENDQNKVAIIVANILRTNPDLLAQPDYLAQVRYKVRAIEYDRDDHSFEIVTLPAPVDD